MQQHLNPFLFAAIIACSATFARGADYSVTLISIGPEQTPVGVAGINNSGQIAGGFQDQVTFIMHSFIYFDNCFANIIPFADQASVSVTGISNSGAATGYFTTPNDDVPHAFLYSQENGMIDLGSLSLGMGVNAAGQVTGGSLSADYSTSHAFLYSDGIMKDLGTLGGTWSVGRAINASGQVVGESSFTNEFITHAFLYASDVITDLGTFGGPWSCANAINDAGQITGYADLTNGPSHAFLYDNGAMIDLGELGGGYSVGLAINNLGQVVGWSNLTPLEEYDLAPDIYDMRAFLYTDGQMIDLNSLIDPASGWILQTAFGINDAGQIVGNGLFDGQYHAFLLTPTANGFDLSSVPEPATLPVLALATIALVRRRRA
ncbi:MAG: PEP-CTERM sorting domain-containing protein [Phycisphaerales bacterium]|nr:PEP-CTERM sorting domain-containing protein [Phycisphaerales bacterium]